MKARPVVKSDEVDQALADLHSQVAAESKMTKKEIAGVVAKETFVVTAAGPAMAFVVGKFAEQVPYVGPVLKDVAEATNGVSNAFVVGTASRMASPVDPSASITPAQDASWGKYLGGYAGKYALKATCVGLVGWGVTALNENFVKPYLPQTEAAMLGNAGLVSAATHVLSQTAEFALVKTGQAIANCVAARRALAARASTMFASTTPKGSAAAAESKAGLQQPLLDGEKAASSTEVVIEMPKATSPRL